MGICKDLLETFEEEQCKERKNLKHGRRLEAGLKKRFGRSEEGFKECKKN